MPLDSRPRGRPATQPPPAYAKSKFRSFLKPRRRRKQKPVEVEMTPSERAVHFIFNNADFLGSNRRVTEYGHSIEMVHLLLTIEAYEFRNLCIVGAELEDAEPSVGSDDLESDELDTPLCQGGEGDPCDDEPSLGATEMIDQRRWSEACHQETANGPTHDLEADTADLEPSLGRPETINQDGHVGDRLDHENDGLCYGEFDECDDEPDYDNEPKHDEGHDKCLIHRLSEPVSVLDFTGIAKPVEEDKP